VSFKCLAASSLPCPAISFWERLEIISGLLNPSVSMIFARRSICFFGCFLRLS